MSKMIRLPVVVLLAGSVSACDMTEQPKQKTEQRDVYASLEDCVADWGDTELCQQQLKEAREHAEKMVAAQAQGSGNHSIIPAFIFFGPSYSGPTRTVTHNGQQITPATNRSSRMATYTPSPNGFRTVSYSAPKTVTPSTAPFVRPSVTPAPAATASRGGFGSTGHASSASSGS